MSTKLEITGLREFEHDLRRLPEALADASEAAVIDATNSAYEQLIAAYPSRPTGNLRRGVRKEIKRELGGIRGIVRSTARHAYLWEYGTASRTTRKGWNRGRSPSHTHIGLSLIAHQTRRKMNERIAEILRRNGFEEVSIQ